jgi:hypothetical protein
MTLSMEILQNDTLHKSKNAPTQQKSKKLCCIICRYLATYAVILLSVIMLNVVAPILVKAPFCLCGHG